MSSATIANKQPSEVKPVTVDFSEIVAGADALSSVVATVYAWDDRDQVALSLDLDTDYPTAATALVRLLDADGERLVSQELSLHAALTVLQITADNESAWEETEELTVSSLGWTTDSCYFKISGGVTGHTYKITLLGTTDDGYKPEQEVLVSVVSL